MGGIYDWKERIQRLKKGIVVTATVIVVILLAVSVFLGLHVILLSVIHI